MNDYQPKVGDRVMVSEHGPYEVLSVNERDRTAVLLHVVDGRAATRAGTAMWSWLAPVPDEPTAPGALVRDGEGVLWARDTTSMKPWVNLDGHSDDAWADIPRPITVVLTDPAEVEELWERVAILTADRQSAEAEAERLRDEVERVRATAEAATADLIHARRRADELQRRVDEAEEAASHATVNANRFEAERDKLRRRIDRALDVLSAPWEGDSAADRLDHADYVLRGGS